MEELRLLWRIQELEFSIKEAEEETSRYPRERKNLEEELLKMDQRLKEAQKELEDLEKRRRRLEQELEDLRIKVKKSKIRLLEVKTNKEYEAVLNEIEWGQNAISSLEEEILGILEEIDKKKVEFERLKEETNLEKGKINELISRLENRQKELKEKVSEWQKEKGELVKSVPEELLELYKNLKHKRGFAIARVKDEICQGCFLHIPPQLYNEILKNERIYTCPNCKRILYYEKESAN